MDDRQLTGVPDLVLTQRAVDRLRGVLEEAGDANCRLRIEASGSEDDPEYVFSFDEHAGIDDVEFDFVRIGVVLDPESRELLRGREVDYRNDAQGERFVIRRGG